MNFYPNIIIPVEDTPLVPFDLPSTPNGIQPLPDLPPAQRQGNVLRIAFPIKQCVSHSLYFRLTSGELSSLRTNATYTREDGSTFTVVNSLVSYITEQFNSFPTWTAGVEEWITVDSKSTALLSVPALGVNFDDDYRWIDHPNTPNVYIPQWVDEYELLH